MNITRIEIQGLKELFTREKSMLEVVLQTLWCVFVIICILATKNQIDTLKKEKEELNARIIKLEKIK